MKKYRFGKHLNQSIVDGILQGYKNYLEERSEKKETMKISSAYAWVRGNHIDDQTAALCEEVGIKYLYAKAGYSWGYLQFINDNKRKMFIVKNGRYLNKDNVSTRKHLNEGNHSKINKNHYLYQLAQINKNINFPRTVQMELPLDQKTVTFDDQYTQIGIVDNELRAFQDKYDYFYIVSYELDQYGMISIIQLLLPSSIDGRAHEVDDLTDYIESSFVDFSTVDTSIIEEEQALQTDYPDAAWFDITTYDAKAKNKKSDQ